MVLDSSAILAIQLREPGSDLLLDQILAARRVIVGAPTVLETVMVLSSRVHNRDPLSLVLGLLRQLDVEIVPFTPAHIEIAADAFLRYGKGRHRASLNYGDCISYAFAAVTGYPLLYVGNDFTHTDLVRR